MNPSESLRNKLISGEPLQFGNAEPKETRTVPADWIVEASHWSVRIAIRNGIITGPLLLKYAAFSEEVSLVHCIFTDRVDFSCATFKRKLDLSATTFRKGADFGSVILEYDGFLCDAKFDAGEANFLDFHARGVLVADRARFAKGVEAIFNRACFDKSAFFKRTHFEGGANFMGTKIFADAHFEYAEFNSKHQPAMFDLAKIEQDAHFEYAVFGGDARFLGAQIDGQARFSDAQFSRVTFEEARIGGNAFFHRAKFERNAVFTHAQITGLCVFGPVTFNGPLSFNSARLDGGISFHGSAAGVTEFRGEADFMHAKIAHADFQLATFRGRALFVAVELGRAIFRGAEFLKGSNPSFRGAQFLGEALFQGAAFADNANFLACHFAWMAHFSREERSDDAVCFRGATFRDVSFDHARFEGDVRFEDAIFCGQASFREAACRVLIFSVTGNVGKLSQFQGETDLRGCTYDRIEANWKSLLSRFVGAAHPERYDRQPYLQMERAYRKAGRDREADDVYLSRQFVERRQKCKNHEYGAWLKSFLHWLVANYGVRPYRLIAVPIVLLVVGMIVFSRPDAARIKREPATATAVSPPATPETPVKSAPESEGYSRGGLAARLSFRIFLPVEVPLAARWEPSDQRLVGPIRFSDLATVLKIAGWILVPLGVAALTGLLRTKPSASAGE